MAHDELKETVVEQKRVFDGKIIHVDHWQVKMPDGRMALREVARHIGASAVVPVDEEGKVTLVYQYRAAVGKVMLEIPAGKLDYAGEDRLEAAKRELQEETGLTAEKWTHLTDFISTPGFCDEKISIYLAQGLSQGESRPDDDEFLYLCRMPLTQAVEKVMQGEIRDGKTTTALLMAARTLGI
jgi:ADP-ribose pyrophosphatase